MKQVIYSIAVLSLALTLTACGNTEFSQTGSDPNLKSSSTDLDVADGDATGQIHTVADLEENPALAELYSCGHGNGAKKVLICHVPPGNPAAAHTICIGAPALDAHLNNHHASSGEHDALGACTEAKKKRCNH